MYFARILAMYTSINILTECTAKTQQRGNNIISAPISQLSRQY